MRRKEIRDGIEGGEVEERVREWGICVIGLRGMDAPGRRRTNGRASWQ